MMQINVLYSSSDGNACRVSTDRTSILIDCGVPKSKLFSISRFPIDAIFISHEHHDHISGIPVLAKNEKATIYLQQIVHDLKVLAKSSYFGKMTINYINPGDIIEIGDLRVHSFESSHDSDGGLNFIVEEIATSNKFAHITDTGLVNGSLTLQLKSCQGLLLEANHDIEMLNNYEDYPGFLKNRIGGDTGHLSNSQAFDAIDQYVNLKSTEWIVFGHLSKKTNAPDIVLKSAKSRFQSFNSFHFAPVKLKL